jgi:hypothetical protein
VIVYEFGTKKRSITLGRANNSPNGVSGTESSATGEMHKKQVLCCIIPIFTAITPQYGESLSNNHK